MEQLLKRISVTNTFPQNMSVKRGFNAFVEDIADIFLHYMGKYKIDNTGLIELTYVYGDGNFSTVKKGVSILRTGNIAKYFDIDSFMLITNENEQRMLVVKDIFYRLNDFAEKYSLPKEPIEVAFNKTLKCDFFSEIEVVATKGKEYKAIVKHRRNLYNTISYKVEIYIKNSERKEVEIDTVSVLGVHDFPNMSISDFIAQVPTFKTIGWQENGMLLFQYGDENKLMFKKYWLNIDNMQISNEIIKNLKL